MLEGRFWRGGSNRALWKPARHLTRLFYVIPRPHIAQGETDCRVASLLAMTGRGKPPRRFRHDTQYKTAQPAFTHHRHSETSALTGRGNPHPIAPRYTHRPRRSGLPRRFAPRNDGGCLSRRADFGMIRSIKRRNPPSPTTVIPRPVRRLVVGIRIPLRRAKITHCPRRNGLPRRSLPPPIPLYKTDTKN